MSLNEFIIEDAAMARSGKLGRMPTAISLFAGAGGCSLGFQQAGFDVRFATDIDGDAVESYRRNFPKRPVKRRTFATSDRKSCLILTRHINTGAMQRT